MTPFIARAVLWLVFGFFVTDIINEFRVFRVPIPWHSVMGTVMLLFGLQEAVLKRLEINRKSSTDPEFEETGLFKICYIFIWIFVICMLLSIPLVWWGIIKKATTAGNSFNWQTPLAL